MKLLLIHLSDIHFKDNGKNILLNRKKELVDSINSRILDAEKIFVIISGDIAFKGSEKEYVIAKDFFYYIKERVKEKNGLEVEFIFASGNHDCQFDAKDSVREILQKQILDTNKCDESLIKNLTAIQKNFLNLREEFFKDYKVTYDNNINTVLEFEYKKKKIIVNVLNTAWFSKLKEKNGDLYMPIDKLNIKRRGNFNMAIFHHNFNWLESNNSRNFKEVIEKNNDLILTGHEHISDQESRINRNGNTEQIQGGVLQDSENDSISSYNLIEIDLEEQKLKLKKFEWKNHIYKETEEGSWTEYVKEKNLISSKHQISLKFQKWLLDTGANYNHPRKRGDIILEDIYVYPGLEKLVKIDDKEVEKEYKCAEFLLDVEKALKYKYLVVGDENAGKTTLLKMLYNKYSQKGFVPIYLKGSEIKENNLEKLFKLIQKKYKEQYSEDTLEEYLQLDKDKRILLIDSFDKSPLNENKKSINTFFQTVDKHCSNLIVTSNDFVQLEEMIAGEENFLIEKFDKYKIEEFGHKLTYELIKKWNGLGLNDNFSEEELSRKNDESKKIIDFSVGRKIVPSYPIFILTSLQTMESRNKTNLEGSERGYYYHFLITEAISNCTIENDEIDSYFNFLSELAYKLYNTESLTMNYGELDKFHEKFKKDYRVSPYFKRMANCNSLKEDLEKSNLLIENSDKISFKYEYIYYFFISRYFSTKLEEEEIQDIVKKLIKNVYKEENANIIMFLTHHTKNKFIIKSLIESAKNIFKEYSAVKFNDDIIEINKLIEKLPEYEVSKVIEVEKNKINSYEK